MKRLFNTFNISSFHLCLILIMGLFFNCMAQVAILPADTNIHIEGSNYIKLENDELVIHRHSDKVYSGTAKENLFNPVKARTSSGIVLEFKTNSPTVVANFKIIKGSNKAPIFSVYQNDVFVKNLRFDYKADSNISLKLETQYLSENVLYKITFPLKTDVHFLGLELEQGFSLDVYNKEKKGTYVAFGDSITHGTGQKTTPETYAYQIAEKMGYELFNLAVGGGKTSQVMAEMIRDDFKSIDIMTILIGFNDYNGEGIDAETFAKRYENVLNTIREKHPKTKLYCITLAYTTAKKSKRTQIPAEKFREVVRTIVAKKQKQGDSNIFLINGDEISTENNLKDVVHFSVEGAKDFANELFEKMK